MLLAGDRRPGCRPLLRSNVLQRAARLDFMLCMAYVDFATLPQLQSFKKWWLSPKILLRQITEEGVQAFESLAGQ